MQHLNDLVLEDIREAGHWRKVIKNHLRDNIKGSNYPHLEELDGYDAMLGGIESALGKIIEVANYLYFENEYNESAWKDMISLFYVDNMRRICNTVMRVHLFTGEISTYNISNPVEVRQLERSYVGYFNIRPIYGDAYCVSYIMLNYNFLQLACDVTDDLLVPMRICTYDRIVHVKTAELHIRTFPYFGRDNKLVVCAQADMLMISRYIYRKLDMPELTLKHICQNRSRDRLDIFPTRGITDRQMMDVFYEREICIRDYSGGNTDGNKHYSAQGSPYSLDAIGNLITSMLDSGLPVLIIFDKHVVIANGISKKIYSTNWKGYQRRYTIYDDSGALIGRLESNRTDIPFLGIYSWKEITAYVHSLQERDENVNTEGKRYRHTRHDDLMVIVPFYRRVTMDYFMLMTTLRENIIYFKELVAAQGDNTYIFNNKMWNNTRVFLIECNELKKQIANICVDSWNWILNSSEDSEIDQADREGMVAMVSMQRAIYEKIVAAGLPHYYWCIEIPATITDDPRCESEGYLYYIFDSAPIVAMDIESVCLNFIHKGDELWESTIKKMENGELIERFFDNFGTTVYVQAFSFRKRIEAN